MQNAFCCVRVENFIVSTNQNKGAGLVGAIRKNRGRCFMQTYMTVKRIRNAPHPPAASGLILFLNGISRFGAFAYGERAVFI